MKKKFLEGRRLLVCYCLTLMLMFVSGPAKANSYQKYVGQGFSLPFPTCPVSNGYINSYAYSSDDVNVSVDSQSGWVTVNSYVSGTVRLQCFIQYMYLVNSKYWRAGTKTEYHTLTVLSNNISISAPKSILNVGETMTMKYSFSTSTGVATSKITWRSNSNCVSINPSTGYLVANSPGTATITATSNLGSNTASCTVTVQKLDPTNISITNTQNSVYCDEGMQLKASVSPSGASQSVTWSLVNGANYATLSSGGYLKGLSPGTATVKATAENGIYTTKSFSIVEPSFIQSSSTPSNNASDISVFVHPSVTFSHDVYEGSNYCSIKLKNENNGSSIEGSVSRSGKVITFTPTKALLPQTNYTLSIPTNAVKNKWDTQYASAINISFKTGDYEKLTLSSSQSNKFLSKGDKITLTASKSTAKIYYTTDGSTPSENSRLYTGSLTFEKDIKLRAIAMGDGYESSEILSMDYYLTNVEIKNKYPNDNTILYLYKDVNPYISFSNKIEAGDEVGNITVKKNGTETVEGEVIVADSTIFFVPLEPLKLGCFYQVDIPNNAIITWLGEPNAATSWIFKTGDYSTDIAQGGDIAAAIKTDGSLLTWGQIYKSGNESDGSYEYSKQETPKTFIQSNVKEISSGLMHNAVIKTDGSLWMWGRQYCGEFGNNSTAGSASPVKIMDDVRSVSCGGQSTAIVRTDGSLWMVGRNDFGQIGDSTVVVKKAPIKVMDDVKLASSNWCTSFAVKTDGTLYAWGRNDNGQVGDGLTENRLEPVEIMKDVVFVASSSFENSYSAVIKTDETLWIWGVGNMTPIKVADNVCYVTTANERVEYVKSDGSLYSYYNGQSVLVSNGVSKVSAAAENLSIVLKNDGSVWSENDKGLVQRLIEGRNSTVLAGLNFKRPAIYMAIGSKNVIAHSPIPIDADYETMTWESSDNSIVSVSNRGVIKACSIGSAYVTATILDANGSSYSTSCKIVVVEEGPITEPNIYVIDKDGQSKDSYLSSESSYTIIDSNRNFNVTENIDDVAIIYSRTFKNTNWQPLYVPFDMYVTNDLLQRFSFAKFAGTYTEEDDKGNVLFYITIVRLKEGDEITANTPYFIQAKTADASNAQIINVDETTLYKTKEVNFSMYSAENKLSVYGIYNQKICAYDGEYYAYSAGKYSRQLTGAKLGAYRFYVTIDERDDNPYGISTPSEIKLKVIGEDEDITDIDSNIPHHSPNDTTYSSISEWNFNLAGQTVSPNYKGIVIKNGKKIYNK